MNKNRQNTYNNVLQAVELCHCEWREIQNALEYFEYKALKRGVLLSRTGSEYKLSSSMFSTVSKPTVYKFCRYLSALKNKDRKLARMLQLPSFYLLWKEATGRNWRGYVKENIDLKQYFQYGKRIYLTKSIYSDGFEIIEAAIEAGIINSETPALLMGAYITYVCGENSSKFANLIRKHKLKVKILGQNPQSPRLRSIAKRLDVSDIDLFSEIEDRCLRLQSEAPELVRLSFENDIDSFYYQGILGLNDNDISLVIHLYEIINRNEVDGQFEILSNDGIRMSRDVFMILIKLYHERVWEW